MLRVVMLILIMLSVVAPLKVLHLNRLQPFLLLNYAKIDKNTLAYFINDLTMKKISYLALTPGVNVIKLFSFIADDEA
jgi:hypothetical protein